MPRTHLRHFILHSILFHIFLGVVIALALVYLFDKETGVGGGQEGGRLEPIIVSVIDENDLSDERSDEAEEATNPEDEKKEQNEEPLKEEKVTEDTELKIVKKKPQVQSAPAQKKPQENQKKEPAKQKKESDTDAVATYEADDKVAQAEGADSEKETENNSSLKLAYNLSEGARPDYGINPKPPYPKSARRRGYEGTVLLRVLVLEDGKVGEIELKGPSGYSVLDESALKAVKKWTFIPGKKGGKQISSWVEVPIKFQLDSG